MSVRECVELSKLSFSWENNNKHLLGIDSFVLNKAEKLFIHGPSGSGKSTLLNLISGVFKTIPRNG